MGIAADLIAASEEWGVEKPSPAFFQRIARELDLPAETIAYVGDRLDNDVLPALTCGMTAIFLARGLWGVRHALRPGAAQADARITSLCELPVVIATLSASPRTRPPQR